MDALDDFAAVACNRGAQDPLAAGQFQKGPLECRCIDDAAQAVCGRRVVDDRGRIEMFK